MATTGPVAANPRTVGDDWTFHADTPADVEDHTGLVVQMRYKSTRELVADSQGEEPTIITGGVNEPEAHLVVPATAFTSSGGDLWLVIRRAVTRTVTPGRELLIEASVDSVQLGGRRTIGTFKFTALAQVAVEVAP